MLPKLLSENFGLLPLLLEELLYVAEVNIGAVTTSCRSYNWRCYCLLLKLLSEVTTNCTNQVGEKLECSAVEVLRTEKIDRN